MRPNLKNNQSRKCGGCGSSDRVPSVWDPEVKAQYGQKQTTMNYFKKRL
jgi:hypothetical protein